MIGKYKVITLIGSTKFKEDFDKCASKLTLRGYIVLPLTVFEKYNQLLLTRDECKMLKDMIMRKIDISDEVYVVNPDGYIGDSTKCEIEYALNNNKKVTFMNSNIDTEVFKYGK